jgi:uncharacterized membrane protein (DUF373 family)
MTMNDDDERPRTWIARAYAGVEDVVYMGLGLLLSGIVLVLLVTAFVGFVRRVGSLSLPAGMIGLLDQILLILLLAELLYTVQVSFHKHVVAAEPFLLVGLISAIRRVLLVTAELGEKKENAPSVLIVELGVLAILILVLASALVMLRRYGTRSQSA